MAIGLLVCLLPPLLYNYAAPSRVWTEASGAYSAGGALVAFLIAMILFRRVASFPGVALIGYVLPAITAGFGIVLAAFLALRLDYSRANFGMSFAGTGVFLFAVAMDLRRGRGRSFHLVPSPATQALSMVEGAHWILLAEPRLPRDTSLILIADLRADLDPEWEKLIAQAAVAGHPVYHVKQVQESLTGRVEIEHLSENSFGSLLPNHSYRKIKRLLDLTAALVAFPVFALPALVVAVVIKLDSPGPVFFRQERRGYRGDIFRVLKFRTMMHDATACGARDQAITRDNDPRITRVGRFLRHKRIDELPQIWNILKGEMSWIGPRPEALRLSDWYEAELPFYVYRHIVRPGITGWAQVNQGHVAELKDVLGKLHYDFYYVKNFSAWLDLLILARTASIVVSGFGAK